MRSSLDYISKSGRARNTLLVAGIYWVVLFVLYLQAANAGRVGDFPGWVTFLNSNSFLDYINRKGSGIPSLYQFTQIVSYCFYQFFGANAWCWHILYISLQALNAVLLFVFFKRLFERIHLSNAAIVSFTGALLFCLSPYISEVVVWEPSFHYLLGLMLMLLVMICAQCFIETDNPKLAWLGGLIFLISSYSLEVFYLTPIFVCSLGLYYVYLSGSRKGVFGRVLLFFTLPQLAIFGFHILMLRVLYHSGIAHVGSVAIQLSPVNLSKALKYVFHIVFFGRFFSNDIRNSVYHLAESTAGLVVFYALFGVILTTAIFRFRRISALNKTIVLLLVWVMFSVGLLLPLWFPDTGLVIYDRYTYVLDGFISMFLSLIGFSWVNRKVFYAIMGVYALMNIRYTHKVNAYWKQSAHIVNNLLEHFPNDPSKKVLLLNLPECLGGVQMVGTRDDGEFRMMYNSIMPKKLTNTVYDVEAFYMSAPGDGAHVTVVNDSTMKVTLNQWGTWWLYYGYGATSYENADYKVIMRDQGHWYDLILKHKASEYLILYVVGDQWKKVDVDKKNVEQN